MTPLLWIAFGLVLLIIIFLMVAFFAGRQMSQPQYNILKVLSTFCAAFAGGLTIGEALFQLQGTFGSGPNYLISGTSGFALALVLWFFFPKYPEAVVLPDSFSFRVPEGWTFKHTVDQLTQQDNAVPEYEGFTDAELNAQLKPWQLNTKSDADAIKLLRSITEKPNAVRKYNVTLENSTYCLRAIV